MCIFNFIKMEELPWTSITWLGSQSQWVLLTGLSLFSIMTVWIQCLLIQILFFPGISMVTLCVRFLHGGGGGGLCRLCSLFLSTRERGSRGLCRWQGSSVAHRNQRCIWGSCTWAPLSDHHLACRVVATFPVKRLNWEDWSSGLRMLCGGASLWRVLIFVFSSIGALSVFACCTPSKRGIFAFEWLSRICVWVLNITKHNTVCSFTWVLLLLYMCLRWIFTISCVSSSDIVN